MSASLKHVCAQTFRLNCIKMANPMIRSTLSLLPSLLTAQHCSFFAPSFWLLPQLIPFCIVTFCALTISVHAAGSVKHQPHPPHFVWPHPQNIDHLPQFFTINPLRFEIITESNDSPCDLINFAIERYHPRRLFAQDCSNMDANLNGSFLHADQLDLRSDSNHLGELRNLTLLFTGECERNPYLGMIERYYLKIDCEQGAVLFGESVWAALRGLETFAQLLHHVGKNQFIVHTARIHDFPRYSHRGLLIDSSRHFLPTRQILRTLDAMEMNKLNVLHWHLTDDQSFPFESEAFPELSRRGAYHPKSHIYTPQDVETVIEYARRRAIRVIPEFDTPGHAFSWRGGAPPGTLTSCVDSTTHVPLGGILDPTRESTFHFLEQLFGEISRKFGDEFVHLGGDEVPYDCWATNSNISAFMNSSGLAGDDFEALEAIYIEELIKIVGERFNKSAIVWQEVFETLGDELDKEVLVQVWIEWPHAGLRWRDTVANATAAGYKILLSAPWYLDHISATPDWRRYYEVEPEDFAGSHAQKKLIIGGEACMWGEFTDGSNLISKTWPRASAVAERLWSAAARNSSELARARFRAHTCRMQQSGGLRVGPADGPSWCPCDVAL